ncbi:MAG TPA: phBC6A51 family helix-turn-helix protein [Acidobacteriota bacterium]|nr:phBC6A51 family helix-turn-helix protein [Acidobacteriota bacterium]
MRWTNKQRDYQRFLARLTHKLDAETMASELGETLDVLHEWEKKKGFWGEVNRLAREEAERALASVWGSLLHRARKGDVAAIKLLFALLGQESGAEGETQPVQFKFVVENGSSATVTADIPVNGAVRTGKS